MNRTRLEVVLVIFAALCVRIEQSLCDNATTEETSALSTNNPQLSITSRLFDTIYETATTEDTLTTTQHPCQAGLVVTSRVVTSDLIEISWDQRANRTNCSYKYDINIRKARLDRKEIPYFRHNNKSQHRFKNLQECTAYNVSIKSSSGAVYRETIRTFPEELKNITIFQENGVLKAGWAQPTNNECTTYVVSVNTNESYTTQNYAILGDPSSIKCTKIKISAVDTSNNRGTAVTREIPGQVQNVKAEPGDHVINLTWDPPEDPSCVTGYRIYLDEKQHDTVEPTIEFTDLEACTSHEGEITAVSYTNDEGPPVPFSAKTSKPSALNDQVGNLRLQASDVAMTASWDPPRKMGACIDKYRIQVWNQDYQTTDYETKELFLVMSPIVPCMVYNFQITPTLSDAVWGKEHSTQQTADPQVTVNPDIQDIVWSQSNINITVKVVEYKINMCSIHSITITCVYSGADAILPWMIGEATKSVEYTSSGNARPPAIISVDNVSPYTDYKCEVVVVNSAGPSLPTEISGKTLEDVPSEPENLAFSEDEETIGVDLSWELPSKVPGILGNYRVNIIYQNSNHSIPGSCEISKGDIVDSETEGTSYLFDSPLPNSKYLATVEASTGVGFGSKASSEYITMQRSSEIVRTLDYTTTNVPGEDYDVTAHITWLTPCNSNGNLLKFVVNIEAESVDNTGEIINNSSEVNVNEDLEDEEYVFNIKDIIPYYNYTVTVYAVTGSYVNPINGLPNTITFVSPEGLPTEPLDLVTSEKDDEFGINLSWKAPIKVPGILGKYKVNIKYKETDHFISESCDIPREDVIGIEVDDTSYFFKNALPNSKYMATVQASTNAGFGLEAELEFVTRPRESEIVRNLTYDVTNVTEDESDIKALIKWLLPCNTNGKLVKFKHEISAVSLENSEITISEIEDIPSSGDGFEEYEFSIKTVQPYYEYTVKVSAVTSDKDNEELEGLSSEILFVSPDGYPSQPQELTVLDVTATNGNIQWKEPANKNGEIISYKVTIETIKPLHTVHNFDCTIDFSPYVEDLDGSTLNLVYNKFLSNFEYRVIVAAKTSAGYGKSSEYTFQTSTSPPEKVRMVYVVHSVSHTEEYKATAYVTFLQPCHLNGDFNYYQFTLIGTRNDFEEDRQELKIKEYDKNSTTAQLKPEYNYEGFVEVFNTEFTSEKGLMTPFQSPAGVPENKVMDLKEPEINDPFTAKFELNQATFTNIMGEIKYFAIILAPPDFEPESDYGILTDEWPSVGYWSEEGELKEYQTTPKEWNPFTSKDSKLSVYQFTIGEENCNSSGDSYCNGPLRPDTEYSLRVRGFTSFGYRDTPKIIFLTHSDINYGALIGGIVGGAIGLLIIFIILIIFWRRRKNKKGTDETAMDTLSLTPVPISIGSYMAHYKDYKTNLNKFKAEYSLLERKAANEQLPMTFAMTDDNKKKNRYINILPYDETRVKLDRDKNDNYTDYINASFIKGYSGNVEYIATQGPLESTVVDFWRMIIQENISVIVMVTQFVEHDKVKCHRYIPNNHETMNIGDGIEIRCANEVPLGGYIKRTLMVQKELMQMTITHLQHIEWPDFGCPNNAESMLDFCNVFRQCIEQYKSKTVIHCSAGVGRTGTLITLDILLQTIENKSDIDIFKTVLNLRKQRMRMVQTEKQYIFIHDCIAEHISNPKKEVKQIEPIYENVVIKKIENEESSTDIP